MASHSSRWQELSTKSRFTCPKLFYKYSSDEQGYKLLFTDLVGLWSEVLEPESIYQYAKATHTSIDPSQSKEQFRVLLQKLEQSLSNGINELFHDPASASGDESLTIRTTIVLPHPLRPLVWHFRLKTETSSEMAEHILRPSLHEASEAKRKIESLLEVIKQKDHIIAKLLERIDNSSIDLSLIFPRITGMKSKKGSVTSREAQAQVPSMAKFNYDVWNELFESSSTYANFQTLGLANLIAGCEECPKHTTEKHGKWLRNLPKSLPEPDTQRGINSNDSIEDVDTSSDGDFEGRSRKILLHRDSKKLENSGKEPPTERVKLNQSYSISIEQDPSVTRIESSQRRNSDASTVSMDLEDLDLPPLQPDTNGKHAPLGQLGKKVSSKSVSKSSIRPSPSSDDLMPPPAISSSSPAPLPPVQAYKPIKTLNSSNNYQNKIPTIPSSPTTVSSLNPSTPHKLSRIKSHDRSQPATPESRARNQQSNTARETSLLTSPTKKPRLGRIGSSRGASQAQSQSQPQHQNSILNEGERNTRAQLSDSDASTSSTASEPLIDPLRPRLIAQESSSGFHTQRPEGGDTVAVLQQEEEQPKKPPELTKEGKANLRRQELKRKAGIASGVKGGGGGIGPTRTAPRKKRKF